MDYARKQELTDKIAATQKQLLEMQSELRGLHNMLFETMRDTRRMGKLTNQIKAVKIVEKKQSVAAQRCSIWNHA